jgi:hypothetical protein
MQASAAAHDALDSALHASGDGVVIGVVAGGQDVHVTLEIQDLEYPIDETATKEFKHQFVTEMAEILGVSPEMLKDVELINSSEEKKRASAQERAITGPGKALSEQRINEQQDVEARSVASLLAASDSNPASEMNFLEGHRGTTERTRNTRANGGISTVFRSAVAAVNQKRAKKKKKGGNSKKRNIEERLHLKTVRALVALKDPATMHSMLVDARGSEWCDSGFCLWCKRPEDDPLRALCPSIDETFRIEPSQESQRVATRASSIDHSP